MVAPQSILLDNRRCSTTMTFEHTIWHQFIFSRSLVRSLAVLMFVLLCLESFLPSTHRSYVYVRNTHRQYMLFFICQINSWALSSHFSLKRISAWRKFQSRYFEQNFANFVTFGRARWQHQLLLPTTMTAFKLWNSKLSKRTTPMLPGDYRPLSTW